MNDLTRTAPLTPKRNAALQQLKRAADVAAWILVVPAGLAIGWVFGLGLAAL